MTSDRRCGARKVQSFHGPPDVRGVNPAGAEEPWTPGSPLGENPCQERRMMFWGQKNYPEEGGGFFRVKARTISLSSGIKAQNSNSY